MASLYSRATPPQHRVLRIIEGAVKNAGDAHPHNRVSPHMARSIAKRAAGTLTAQWPEVLAARTALSDCDRGPDAGSRYRRPSHPVMAAGRGASRRSPLGRLWKALARKMRSVRDEGDEAKVAAYIDVLRTIAALQAEGLR